MPLADFEIRQGLDKGLIGISPFEEKRLQPVSYDLTLHKTVRIPKPGTSWINPFNGDVPGISEGRRWPYEYTVARKVSDVTLRPGDFILACTRETVHLDATIAARVEGKSSLGRLGVMVHITAGFIDPGFVGQITLEIFNAAPWEIPLMEGMSIAQIVFEQVSVPERTYADTGSYQGQMGPTESRYKPWG